jgi:hypothetical protein
MRDQRWLAVTHQQWKGAVAVLGAVATLGSFAWFVQGLDDDRDLGAKLSAFAASGAFTVAWMLLAVRCPSCGHRPVWRLWRSGNANSWVARLLSLDRCPSCGRSC